VPPDTNGAVGATQYVQMVNVTIAVYAKRNGAIQLGPAPIHSLWRSFGGLCENGGQTATYSDGGDPIVLYDHLADRWMVSPLQFDETFTKTAQCIAVSTSSSPARRRRSSSRARSSIPTPTSGWAASRWTAPATSPSASTR
jgi:hypothetical protein